MRYVCLHSTQNCTHCIHLCAIYEARQFEYNILIFGVMATLMRLFFGMNLMRILRVHIRTISFCKDSAKEKPLTAVYRSPLLKCSAPTTQELVGGSVWLQILNDNVLVTPDKHIFSGEISGYLFVLYQQYIHGTICTYQCWCSIASVVSDSL